MPNRMRTCSLFGERVEEMARKSSFDRRPAHRLIVKQQLCICIHRRPKFKFPSIENSSVKRKAPTNVPQNVSRCCANRMQQLSSILGVIKTGGVVLPYMGYICICRRKGYGFQAVYSGTGYINQRFWV